MSMNDSLFDLAAILRLSHIGCLEETERNAQALTILNVYNWTILQSDTVLEGIMKPNKECHVYPCLRAESLSDELRLLRVDS